MDNNFIKDNQVLPEEMHGILKTSMAKKKTHNTTTAVWWIFGLFVLLALVFFVGLMTGKKAAQTMQELTSEEEQIRYQKEVQTTVDIQRKYRDTLTQEERSQRIRTFFSE